jgi:branched-chain amino acid transport system substrate-binding protein
MGAGVDAARRGLSRAAAVAAALLLACGAVVAAEPIRIGLDADFTGPAVASSEAIRQGAEAAIAEINAAGGVAGRPLELATTDHRGNPLRGVENFEQLIRERGIVALLTGAHSPVALAQVEVARAHGVPLISPWAAATAIVDNGLDPNPAFRVSVRDADAAGYLVGRALAGGDERIAMVVENTPWGKSNHRGVEAALRSAGIGELVGIGWFSKSEHDIAVAAADALASRPDAIIFIGVAKPAVEVLRAVAALPEAQRPRVLTHWGVMTSDGFGAEAARFPSVEVEVLQTFSFHAPPHPDRAARALATTCRLFGICAPGDVAAPAGLAHAYDAVRLVALGVEQVIWGAQPDLRAALEHLPPHDGLVRRYDPAFTPDRHEALTRSDYRMAAFDARGRPAPAAEPAPR